MLVIPRAFISIQCLTDITTKTFIAMMQKLNLSKPCNGSKPECPISRCIGEVSNVFIDQSSLKQSPFSASHLDCATKLSLLAFSIDAEFYFAAKIRSKQMRFIPLIQSGRQSAQTT